MNRNYRRLVALVATGAVLVAGLSGCGSKKAADSDVKEIKVAVAGGFFPITYADDNGEAQGYDVEVLKAVDELAKSMINPKVQPCTSCRYCTSHCPNEIDIPLMMSLYNEAMVTGADWREMMALNAIPKEKWPQACVGCGACQAVCPQSLKIPEVMTELSKIVDKMS